MISGASVQLHDTNSTAHFETKTGTDGSFKIAAVSAGHYRLTVFRPGFDSKDLAITVLANQSPAPLRIVLSVGTVNTNVEVQDRADNLVGIATSAGQITVGQEELKNRPILRSGEVLETLPGLIITQHAGGGKANQYYLRGFNLDHGTDFAIFLDGMPLNLPSHAHGEGYSDMNTVIPELVQRVDARKGPYYGDVGDFGSAGNAQVVYFKTLPQNFIQVDGGMYQFARLVFGASQKLGKGNLLVGGEAYHDGGPWVRPDNYYKFNGITTYSQGNDDRGFSMTGRIYAGTRWNSSDQLPYTAFTPTAPGQVGNYQGFFGALDNKDGGHSHRYSLQGEWHKRTANSETKLMAYGFYYDMNLWSDFTYYLLDPYKGDQFEQQDRRWVAGFDLRHTISGQFFGRKSETTFGMQLRNDWVHNGLYRTQNRVRTSKTMYTAGIDPTTGEQAVLPADTDLNKFTETIGSPWVSNQIQWTNKFKSILALRGDAARGIDTSFSNPTNFPVNPNNGSASKFLPSPKASMIFGPWNNTEFYLQGGFSFHTNDVRGATQQYQPVSPDSPYINTAVGRIPLLIQTKGAEVGVRTAAIPHLQTTAEIWYLHSNSELLQSGDTGGTSPSQQSSDRYGFEVGNYYTPTEHLAFDVDFADSRALFAQQDPDDATYYTYSQTQGTYQLCARNTNCYGIGLGPNPYQQNANGREVPEAVKWVVSAGATLKDYKGFSASLRLRYFGARPLTSDALYKSPATALVNLGGSYKFNQNWTLMGEVLNLLNRRDHDVDYAYVSQIAPASALGLPATAPTDPAGQAAVAAAINANAAFTRVMHPVEPIQARFTLRYSFGR